MAGFARAAPVVVSAAAGVAGMHPRRSPLRTAPPAPRPSGAAGGQGRASPLAGWPLGAFRPLRRAGARSGTAPLAARSPRTAALASLARCGCSEKNKKAPIRKVVQIFYLDFSGQGRLYWKYGRHPQPSLPGAVSKDTERAAQPGGSFLILIQ